MKRKHTTRDGREMLIKDMDDGHLLATIRLHRKLAKRGITVRYGGGGVCAEGMWYDEDHLYGAEALSKMNHHWYVEEAERRGLNLNFMEQGELADANF